MLNSKEWIIDNLEQDWDNDNMYYEVSENGLMRKYDIENNMVFEYQIKGELSATH